MFRLFLLFALIVTFTYASDETKTYSNKNFTEISICCGMKLRVTQSDNYSVKITADSKDFENLAVEQEGSELNFYIKKNNYRIKNDIKIEISTPDLRSLNASGGAMANIIKMKTQNSFSTDLSGGAVLIGNLESRNSSFELSGGSSVSLKGSGGNAELNGSGGCTFDLKDFAVKDVDAELSGGTMVKIRMDGTLNTSQSGGSQLTFYGTAKLGSTSFSGGSEVNKGD